MAEPIVISDKIQEFLGERYYRCGVYFRRAGRLKSVLLHRIVWAFHNDWTGIPDGYDVHHKDENPANNQSSNLQLLPRFEHRSGHKLGKPRKITSQALAAAAEWHGSDAGIAWHKEHHLKTGAALYRVESFECQQCRRVYRTNDTGRNRFCSDKCKAKWRYLSGKDNEERCCVICSGKFVVNRYVKKQTCSRKCWGALSGNKRRGQSRRVLPNRTGNIGV